MPDIPAHRGNHIGDGLTDGKFWGMKCALTIIFDQQRSPRWQVRHYRGAIGSPLAA
jgi:hypothetical protein